MEETLRSFLDKIFTLLYFAIFARIMVSWIAPQGSTTNPIVRFIFQITEPILAPIRRVVPRMGMFDFTPTIALITIFLIQMAIKP